MFALHNDIVPYISTVSNGWAESFIDFWVQPSEKMIRIWCQAYSQALDFETDYQPWVVREFSGILCVDEVYQDDLALSRLKS